jgi:hypothetical protein
MGAQEFDFKENHGNFDRSPDTEENANIEQAGSLLEK